MKTYIPAKLYDAKGDLRKQWFVFFSVTDPATGKMKRFRILDNLNQFKSRKERAARGRVLIKAYNDLLTSGWSPFDEQKPAAAVTLAAALESAMADKVAAVRPVTAHHYRLGYNMFIRWARRAGLDQRPVAELQKRHVLDYLHYLSAERRIRNRSRNNYRDVLCSLFNHLLKLDLVKANPVHGTPVAVTERKAQLNPFTQAEAAAVTAWLAEHDPDLLLLVRFIYYTALRPKEILEIRIRQIEFDRQQIRIHSSQAKDRESAAIRIPAVLLPALEHLRGLPGDWYLFTRQGNRLLPGPADKPIIRNRISERFKYCKDALKLPADRNLYSFKHYAAIRAYEAGVDVIDIMNQFRHSSLDMTYKYLSSLGLKLADDYGRKIPEL